MPPRRASRADVFTPAWSPQVRGHHPIPTRAIAATARAGMHRSLAAGWADPAANDAFLRGVLAIWAIERSAASQPVAAPSSATGVRTKLCDVELDGAQRNGGSRRIRPTELVASEQTATPATRQRNSRAG
ncbi:hypothetical protein PF005_g103 [Phytophthora fragariae]|uniref:Uncharacterized protein n=1 Tax=Phytophthora fragariae TaxID=53985 RepID=A0A6A4AKY0_9STRA|nr:hypothetical protein PF003_g32493 [Phytophthora fragariae]KAE8950355.1 hypothetical protein PF009_g103 [Phytophthora fragariae]KAE9238686.1 hypothetical protein PF005_g103 [Phytophthora fragariae]KAE9256532.1 hypothetical protein PF004_g31 [Phytophthora fragariae]KAE9258471.1 hypothetical protein PF002_g99 [Phytophthora fragariae]